ncbi:MAG: hypothetical protein K5931_09600 [Lachnospiraceae bacterium]|nr:hypothetical protein [Lachnospiraceae bacterium]
MKKCYLMRTLCLFLTSSAFLVSACNSATSSPKNSPVEEISENTAETIENSSNSSDKSVEAGTYSSDEDGGHAITVDGETAEYSNATVSKTGNSEGDEADFYGENSAIFATNKANLTLSDMDISTDGKHANGVFSYGEGTVINISESTINTKGDCSGGIMTTGGATMNASNLEIHTSGNSSAAIRSDRGGGIVTVTGGNYITDGKGSPAVYSTADITINDASLTSNASEGIVVEGRNSVTLNNVTLSADHNQHNSDKSDIFKGIMIYQSMSGDADTGLSKFTANGGSITNNKGDVFFVNNTATDISLSSVNITNKGDGVFLRAAAAGWGNEGSNGGKVNLTASSQAISGDFVVDDISTLNLYLKEASTFEGAINNDATDGKIYLELDEGSKWILTADSNISSLTCDEDSIDLNGYTLTVDGKTYEEATSSQGEMIEIEISENSGKDGDKPAHMDGNGEPLGGDGSQMPKDMKMKDSGREDTQFPKDGERPTPPDGQVSEKPNGEPPQKPDGEEMKGEAEKTIN